MQTFFLDTQIDATTIGVYCLILIGISVAISYFLFRWIFSMKRQLWNQKQQIILLIKIAEKLGVPRSETELIEEKTRVADQYL